MDNEPTYSLQEMIYNLRDVIRYLRKRWWMFLFASLIGAVLGAFYYGIQQPKYQAVTSFILEDKSASGGGLASMASQFGFNLGGMSGGGGIFSGDNILNILKSKKIVQKVLLSKVDVPNSQNSTLVDLYLDFTGFKKNLDKRLGPGSINFNKPDVSSVLQDSVLNLVYETILEKNLSTERAGKQSSIINVQVTAANPVFANLMTQRLVDEASKLYMDIRIGTLQSSVRQLESRADSLLMLLNRKSFAAAASQPLDINPGVRTAVVPLEIASRDKTVLSALYGEVAKNLEASRLLLAEQTPVIQVLDVPGLTLKNIKKGKIFCILMGACIAVAISFGSVLFMYLLSSFNKSPIGKVSE